MIVPDYKGGSIPNLMASIAGRFKTRTPYEELKILPAKQIKHERVVLLMLDGLGIEWLKKYGKKSALFKHLKGQMTSVFPSTTAAAVSSYASGVAPQEHGITGWFQNIKELGCVSAVLPFKPRLGKQFEDLNPKEIFTAKPIADQLKIKTARILPEEICDKPASVAMGGKARRIAYDTLDTYFSQTAKFVMSQHKGCYAYGYWPSYDSLCHEFGSTSEEVKEHFEEIDWRFAAFLEVMEDTTIIATADHGHIDAQEVIWIEDHPKLEECLTLSLCGEPRAAYCYVRPSKADQFEKYIQKHLSQHIDMRKGEDLIREGFFGLGKAHPRLFDRVGDYVLLMKGNTIIRDRLLTQEKKHYIGNHGGVSKLEMLVPVITADC